jgi:hypothetical protein
MRNAAFWPAFLAAVAGLTALLSVMVNAPAPAQAQTQDTVTVEGRVINGTQDGDLPAGLPLSLHIFALGDAPVTSLEGTTDDQAAFQFPDVALEGDMGYALTMDYAGMRYSKLMGAEDLSQPLEFLVYETTQDLSVVTIMHQALVITGVDAAERRLDAVEFISLANHSDRTLLPDTSTVDQGQFSFLRFSLPSGATQFDIQTDLVGGEAIPVGMGFGLTSPVVPGEHSVSFTYRFPYEGSAFSYRQSLIQGADLFQVLLPERLGPLQVANLEEMPPLNVQGATYRVWEVRDVAPGQGPVVQITNLPQPSFMDRATSAITAPGFWHNVIPITLGGALALVLLYAAFRSPRAVPALPAEADPDPAGGQPAQRAALVRAVAALDEEFHRGEMAESDYRSRRDQLKERITQSSGPGGRG